MSDDVGQVKAGDLREGTGGMKELLHVSTINEDSGKAYCVLVKSGTAKVMSLVTLRRAYRLLQRDHAM